MPSDPQKIQALFLRMVELPFEDRAAAMDRECGTDVELRRRLEVLLTAHDQQDSYLDQPDANIDVTLDSGPIGLASEATSHHMSDAKVPHASKTVHEATSDFQPDGAEGVVIAGR